MTPVPMKFGSRFRVHSEGAHPLRGAWMLTLALAATSTTGWAANCSSSGNLRYLGVTNDGAKSVWLSATSPGQFELESAKGGLTVDAWTKQRRGLRVSVSPEVSNGNGGTHKLYVTDGSKPCLLDTQNQKDGFVFPSTLPPFPPIGVLPPVTGLMPGMPGGIIPPIATLPPSTGLTPTVPGGVTPPIATLPPPTGVMPTVPGGVTPPIATLPPPTGVMPTVPGGVTPPIATLPPPTGLTPTVPGGVTPPVATLPPPTGVMPTVPGGVTPPIATLPPSTGLTPTVPGGVTPPIATLPPPTGVMPTVPGGVTPPIATLPPPSGLMPTVPGGVTPPIATLPPPTGLTPMVPGVVTPPLGSVVPSGEATRIAAGANMNCGVGLPERSATGSADTRAVDCVESQLRAAAPSPTSAVVPLTEGRDLVVESLWNGWVDLHHIGSQDRRNGLDLDNSTGGVTLGVDRRFGANIVAGLSLSLARSDSDSFGGTMTSQTKGLLVGPYLAVRLSDHWAADAAIAWGRDRTDTQFDVLHGSVDADRTTFAANANGQYEFDGTLVRPRLSAYYAHLSSGAYALQGDVAGQSISLAMASARSNYGMAEASGELTRSFTLSGGSVVAPYARLAVRYEFTRPNDGEILAGDLSTARTSPWGGSLRVGARALADRATMIEAEAGYLSLGQAGLDVWELRLYLSHAF